MSGVSNDTIYSGLYRLLIMYNGAVDDKLSKSFINKEQHDSCQSLRSKHMNYISND